MSPYFLVPLIFFSASFLQGLTGFGSALIAMPLLSFVVDIKTAVVISALCGICINLSQTVSLRSNLDMKKIGPLLLGCIPGAAFGTYSLKEFDSQVILLCLGCLVAGYATFSLLIKPVKLNIKPTWGVIPGFLTGAITASVGAGGPPTIIFSSLSGWEKNDFKATLAGFFLSAAGFSAIGHAASGLTTLYSIKLFLVSLLPVLVGTKIGNGVAGKVSENLYRRIVMILLVFIGLMLIFQNV
ncbi:sulfite exporter TauE/SafE family protein [Marinifilum sp. JC120]|nr:sulfite exporter TauE/SafE family protein [Marinifilum sp. JC120]